MFVMSLMTLSLLLSLNSLPLRSSRKLLDDVSSIMTIFYTCCILIFHYFRLVLVRHLITVVDISGSRPAVNKGTLRSIFFILPTMYMSLLLGTVLKVTSYDGEESESV